MTTHSTHHHDASETVPTTDRLITLIFAVVGTVGVLPGLLGLLMSGGSIALGLGDLWERGPSAERLGLIGMGALSLSALAVGFILLPRYYRHWREWTPWRSGESLWTLTIASNSLGATLGVCLGVAFNPIIGVMVALWGLLLVTLAGVARRAERVRHATLMRYC